MEKDKPHGKLWDELNDLQKQELLLAYDESFNLNNLAQHEDVKKQHKKWLHAGKANLSINLDQSNIRDIAYD